VRIGVSQPHRNYLAAALEKAPDDIVVRALIDTGASVTLIDNSVIEKLRLQDRGECKVRGFDNSLHASLEEKIYLNYDVSFAILNKARDQEVVIAPALQAVGADLGYKDFDVLLGLDVLKLCTLFMDLSGDHFDIGPSSPYPVKV
jgi:predicted aspartyl protease